MNDPQLTTGPVTECPLGRHGKYACPVIDTATGKTVTVSHGDTPEAAESNAKMLANNPAYLESIRPQKSQ